MAITMNFGVPLACPYSYTQASEEELAAVCNGCGAAGAKFDFVPDSMWGLDVSFVCNIHDWGYAKGTCEQDRLMADLTLLNNLLIVIEMRSANRAVKLLRNRRALKYFEAVRAYGSQAFWAGKLGERA